jgi:cytochrome P450
VTATRWHPAVVFDLNSPDVIADPYPTYARLRDEAPISYLGDLDLWVLSRYDDVSASLRDPETFSSDLRRLARGLRVNPFNPDLRIPGPLVAFGDRLPWGRVLLTSDPPEHTVLRRKISKAFTPRAIAEWELRVAEITESLVRDLLAAARAGPVDLVRDLASPLPTMVIAELLAVPAERRRDFRRWSGDLVGGLVSGGPIGPMIKSAVAITRFFAGVVRQRRSHRGEDLISRLVSGRDEDALGVRDLVTFCVLLLVAGNETTTNLIANAVWGLFAWPEVESHLRSEPALAGAIIEETIRYDNPAQGLLRVTTAEVTNGSALIPAGSKVLTLVGSANRDSEHFTNADEFRPGREETDHLGFGTGIHLCIGAPLARMEGRIALETLFRHAARIAPAGDPERIPSPVLRGLRSLPVTLRPR